MTKKHRYDTEMSMSNAQYAAKVVLAVFNPQCAMFLLCNERTHRAILMSYLDVSVCNDSRHSTRTSSSRSVS
jgi:hypothetical protein